jgi:predicted nucleic acid-binding protein
MAGLHDAEIGVIYYAYQNRVTALLDEDSARVFARSLGVDVKGSLGLLIGGLREGLITREEALKGLDKLADVMYLSASVYKLVLKEIEKW